MNEILLFLAVSTFAVLGFGFLLGLKHATEADHLAAVGTIVSERKNLLSSALVGGMWRLGHTISLLLAGIFVLLLNFEISEQTERILEFCVGLMLLFLGINVLRKVVRSEKKHFHTHENEDISNSQQGLKFSIRSIIIGMIHGLAGSAGMMLLYLPTIESNSLKLIYIVIFGIGSIGGMMIMSFLVGLPFHLTAAKFDRFNNILQTIAGLVSIVIGLIIVYEKAITEGMFS